MPLFFGLNIDDDAVSLANRELEEEEVVVVGAAPLARPNMEEEAANDDGALVAVVSEFSPAGLKELNPLKPVKMLDCSLPF